ncbi:MAG TPA: hypothetical protein VKW06_00285 [Candidatus Angelobacter sp.]|nr:hypothetical protein [Candidatus Angelobacter sp.]
MSGHHTAGPLMHDADALVVKDLAGRLIAKLSLSWGEVTRNEAVANGFLFASAPDLLAACHAFCRAFSEPKQDLDAEKNAIRHAYDLGRTAIEKAEGRR